MSVGKTALSAADLAVSDAGRSSGFLEKFDNLLHQLSESHSIEVKKHTKKVELAEQALRTLMHQRQRLDNGEAEDGSGTKHGPSIDRGNRHSLVEQSIEKAVAECTAMWESKCKALRGEILSMQKMQRQGQPNVSPARNEAIEQKLALAAKVVVEFDEAESRHQREMNLLRNELNETVAKWNAEKSQLESQCEAMHQEIDDIHAASARASSKAEDQLKEALEKQSDMQTKLDSANAKSSDLQQQLIDSEAHGEKLAMQLDVLSREVEFHGERAEHSIHIERQKSLQLIEVASTKAQAFNLDMNAAQLELAQAKRQMAQMRNDLSKAKSEQVKRDDASRLKIEKLLEDMSSERFKWEQKLRGAELATSSMSKASQKKLQEATASLSNAKSNLKASQQREQHLEAIVSDLEISLKSEKKAHEEAMANITETANEAKNKVMHLDAAFEKATADIETFRKKEQEMLSSISAANEKASNLSAEIAEQAVKLERAKEVEAELEGWKMRTSSLQRRLSDMESDMLEERRTTAKAIVEMQSSRSTPIKDAQPTQTGDSQDFFSETGDTLSQNSKKIKPGEPRRADHQRNDETVQAEALMQAWKDAENNLNLARSRELDLQNSLIKARARAERAEQEIILQRTSIDRDKLLWKEKESIETEKRKERDTRKQEEREELQKLAVHRDMAVANAEMWMERAKKAEREAMDLVSSNSKSLAKAIRDKEYWQLKHSDVQEEMAGWQSKYEDALKSARQQRAKDTELFRMSSDKVIAEVNSLKEKLIKSEYECESLRGECDTLEKRMHLQLVDASDSESNVKTLQRQVQDLSKKIMQINRTVEVERDARSKSELLVETLEAEKARLELEVRQECRHVEQDGQNLVPPESNDDDKTTLLTPARKDFTGSETNPEVGNVSSPLSPDQQQVDLSFIEHANSALREALARSVTEMRSMQAESIRSQEEVRSVLDNAEQMRTKIVSLEEELLRVKRAHLTLGFESREMLQQSVEAERMRCEEIYNAKIENLKRLHENIERELLKTGEIATDSLAKALARAQTLEEENAVAAKIFGEMSNNDKYT